MTKLSRLRAHSADASALTRDGTEWKLERAAMSQKAKALDATGGEAATFEPKGVFKRGGELRTGGHSYELRPASNWKTRYAIAEGERELATLETKGWSQHRVAISLEADVPSEVLLMACWLVRSFADDSAAATASIG